jgi:hypothetical protein
MEWEKKTLKIGEIDAILAHNLGITSSEGTKI